jgi:hypothetical protein
VIQDSTKTHREIVCGKISEIKLNHASELKEIKEMVKEKASHSDLRGMIWLVGILITVCIAVVAGQGAWLRSDISTIMAAIQRLNIRVTDSTNERMHTEVETAKALEQISGRLGTINLRLTEIESKKNGP